MSYHLDDTIAAIASPPGGAARGIVRLSGPHVIDLVEPIFRPGKPVSLKSLRTANCIPGVVVLATQAGTDSSGRAALPLDAELPADLFLWPTERSYTRQPIAELHTLGSPPLLDALLETVCRGGARLAEPGEFSMRAFLAGRLDLAQAEAVLGVIHARGTNQLQTALRQLAGGLSGPLHAIREELINILAELEAGLDFVEEDIEFISPAELDRRLAACEEVVAASLDQMAERENRGADFRVVLAGPPNVGKSSLFNALVERYGDQATTPALVSTQAGTTRDSLTARVILDGCRCELIDTAGVAEIRGRTVLDDASAAAARSHYRSADLLIACIDAASALQGVPPAPPHLEDKEKIPAAWYTLTKADLVEPEALGPLRRQVNAVVATSSLDHRGLDDLVQRIAACARDNTGTTGMAVAATAARCRDSLLSARQCLKAARRLAIESAGEELVAVELREALHKIGLVVGTVYTDDILDRIFSRFCIGK